MLFTYSIEVDHNFALFLEYLPTGGIPPQIFACRNLRTLVLRCQGIRSIPDDISRLRRLGRLIIDSNPCLEAISGEVGKLPIKGKISHNFFNSCK